MQNITKTMTVEELDELLMETTQRDCGGWPETEDQPQKEEDEDD